MGANPPIDHLACFVPLVTPFTGTIAQIVLPEVFSFVQGPGAAVEIIHAVVAASLAGVERITIDGSGLEYLDTCAASVLTAVLIESRSRGIDVRFRFPIAQGIRVRLAAGGLARLLTPEELEGFPRASLLPLHQGGRNLEWDLQTSEDIVRHDALRIRDRVEQWVWEHQQCQLADAFDTKLTRALVEAVENVSFHTRSDWWVSAHLEDVGGRPRVYATIFNFGRSIAESLDISADSPTQREYAWLRLEHECREGFSATWTHENLLTLLGIQDGSTGLFVERDRGAGTLHWVQFYEYLADAEPERPPVMSWVSGSTRILLQGEYRLRDSMLEPRRMRRDIAFNATNDLRLRPDRRAVMNLGKAFPGTIVTVHFDLCDQFLAPSGGTAS